MALAANLGRSCAEAKPCRRAAHVHPFSPQSSRPSPLRNDHDLHTAVARLALFGEVAGHRFFLAAAIAAGIFSEIGASVEALAKIGEGAFAVAGVATYFAIFLIWTAMAHAFITMPLWKHYAETLTVIDPRQIGAISQRPRDEFEEAEGFADALDVGAAI